MKECLRQSIGSCNGCNIQSMTKDRIIKVPNEQREAIVKRIQNQLCPKEEIMQTPRVPKQKIW